MEKIVYYNDELNDDFSGFVKKTRIVDENYKYIRKNFIYKVITFIIYRIIMKPFSFIYCKLVYGVRIKNKKVLKHKKNYFLYGNHTLVPLDAFVPNILKYFQKYYFVVNADNVSTRGLNWFMNMVGAIPIPSNLSGMKVFNETIKERSKKSNIVIFPEAHIWPYYTKIRNFKSTSFLYPLKEEKEVFAFTTTYQKRKIRKKPRVTIYIDGPFKSDKESIKEKKEDLRNMVYETMKKRSLNSNYEYIKYVKGEKNDD